MKIFVPIFLILILVGGYFGYNYYSETYAGTEAYAKVPSEIPEKKPTTGIDGKMINGVQSYKYNLTFVYKNGTVESREVEISGETPTPLEPNSYVKLKLSKKRITEGPTTINENSIPAEILTKLNSTKD